MSEKISKFFKYYLPLIIWMGVIYYFSSIPDLKVGMESLVWEIILRKAGHMAEFAILFWLFFRLTYHSWNIVARDAILLSLVFVSGIAVSDEFHQRGVAGRSGRIIDVIFDIFSAAFAWQIIVLSLIKKHRKKSVVLLVLIIGSISLLEYKMVAEGKKMDEEKKMVISQMEMKNTQEEARIEEYGKEEEKKTDKQESESLVPDKIKIDVPFTSQAPYANWDAYHEEACEEASIIMVKYYLDNKKLTSEIAEKEIQAMIKYQMDNYGTYKDSSAEQMIELARKYYQINNLRVVKNFKREDLRKYLAKGRPIIIPAAGQLLGNPNYKAPGPPYHVLVLTGFDGNNVITNDPGTRKGHNYIYDINIFYNAIHDFTGKLEDIQQGPKAMIVIE